MEDYEKKAQQFLSETGTTFKVEFYKYDFHFLDDKDKRDIYTIILKRGSRDFIFNFGQSLANSGFKLINQNTQKETKYIWFNELTYNNDKDLKKLKLDIERKIGVLSPYKIIELKKEPTVYDVLASLTTYDVGTFKDFCSDFGYNEDSIKANKIYNAVVKEYENLKMLFSDEELNKLQEIL